MGRKARNSASQPEAQRQVVVFHRAVRKAASVQLSNGSIRVRPVAAVIATIVQRYERRGAAREMAQHRNSNAQAFNAA